MDNPEIPALFDHIEPYVSERWGRERFEYFVGTKGPKKFFVKAAKSSTYYTGIQREVVWNEFMNRVEAFYPERQFVGPRIERRIGKGALVFDYVDGTALDADDELAAWQANLSRYAEMLDTFDRVAVNWKAENLPDEPSRSLRVYSTWQAWLGERIGDVKHIDKARHLVETASFKLTRCLQHGGPLHPSEIIIAGERWVVFDGEHCGSDLFRYTDLADGCARLYGFFGAKASAAQLVRDFISCHQRPRDDFTRDFLPVLAHRSVALLSDAFRDQPTHDYVADTKDLLQLCVDQKLEALIG